MQLVVAKLSLRFLFSTGNHFLFCLLFFMSSLSVFSQERIRYAYDQAGNRVKREIVLNIAPKSARQAPNPEAVFYDVLDGETVKISPNPSGIIRVSIPGMKTESGSVVEVYTAGGISVLKKHFSGMETEVDISNRPQGVYLLRVTVCEKSITWKIIKN